MSRGVMCTLDNTDGIIRATVRFADNGGTVTLWGGRLAGLQTARDEQVLPHIEQLDGLAAALIQEVNRIHASGQGLSNGGWFTEASVRDIFEPMHRQLTMAAVEKASAETNRLLRPVAYLETLRHTARRLDEPLPSLFVTLPDHPILFILISGVLVLFCAISIAFPTRRQLSPAQSIAIFSASGSAFLFQIALMSLLQVYSGQIYHFLAFFTISFMAGITGGSLLSRVKTISSLLSLGALALLSAGILLSAAADLGAAGYISLNAIAGILLGITMGNLARSSDTERSPGAAFYVADLAGAALCGLFFGAAMLPLFDLRLSLAVAGGLALIGMFALNKDRSRNNDF